MPAEEARTSDDQVPSQGELRTHPMPAAKAGDERADKEERRNVRGQGVNRADPSFGA